MVFLLCYWGWAVVIFLFGFFFSYRLYTFMIAFVNPSTLIPDWLCSFKGYLAQYLFYFFVISIHLFVSYKNKNKLDIMNP